MSQNFDQLPLSSSEMIFPASPLYQKESCTWAAQKDLKPKIIARPCTPSSLGDLLFFLTHSDLDWAVRSTGVGSSSASDVLISLSAFDKFEYNAEDQTVVIGAGQTWGEVDRKVEENAPGHAVVGARCTYVGVGGSILSGGISWLSSEKGLAADPHNMLDAKVVLTDGRILWASTEPELLWALRGGGGSFGVLVEVILRVHRYPDKIYSGQISYPRSAFSVVAKAIGRFTAECNDPKMAMHIFPLDLGQGHYVGDAPNPGIGLHVFDAHGEIHGRGTEGFRWALDIEGAIDNTGSMTLQQCNQIWDGLEAAKGKTANFQSCLIISHVDEELISKAWHWIENLTLKDPSLSLGGTYLLIEFMQKSAFHSVDPTLRAWPGTRGQSILQIGTGAPCHLGESRELAYREIREAPSFICGQDERRELQYFTHSLEEFNDPRKIYAENFEKLQELKRRYDPDGGLKGPFWI
ncbi:hypothetical protein PENSOL_c057G04362 [Penicillium solitum]|uniref:FAD-binding PCMH-type domain-containing protein n=1 Tax=Penicillium solitum TaxID=60172 RepID=A0A1V6QPT7_9EURO|nr:uncharacterized protein PENSOL_c057G04362 [Penicillium solitum]OQD91215.1 hypothetical protein PENSOL_c057G04362 [Penicillium solitum]